MRKNFPDDGWTTEWVKCNGKEIHFNLHNCIYWELTKCMIVQSWCCVNKNDDISFSGLLPKITCFERTGTLGNGSPYCDFHFLKVEVKPMIKNYLSHFLPVLLALDLIIPFLLAPFYKDYNHLTQVMSVLEIQKHHYIQFITFAGCVWSCNFNQHLTALSYCRTSIKFYIHNAFSVIVIYAVGGCILSGIFSVGETKSP